MSIKEIIKQILILIKLEINEIPVIRNFVIKVLMQLPSLFKRLQSLKLAPTFQVESEIEKIFFSSTQSEQIFKDIKNAIKKMD